MRRKPSRQGTCVGPVGASIRVVSMQALSIVRRVGAKTGSSPVSSPSHAHQFSMLTDSLPPQFTIVAGTDAAASRRGRLATRSSSWIGLNRLGAFSCTAIGFPARISSRWTAGQPPASPYGTLRRAISVGSPSCRAEKRATPSAAILQML